MRKVKVKRHGFGRKTLDFWKLRDGCYCINVFGTAVFIIRA